MWDISSRERDQTLTSCIGKQSLNLWTTGEDTVNVFFWAPIYEAVC